MFDPARLMARFSPDLEQTLRRFFFAVLLIGLGTLVMLAIINEWVPEDDITWDRLSLGLYTAALLATAGQLFVESRTGPKWLGYGLTYLVPAAVILLCQIRANSYIVVEVLPLISILWLSVSAYIRLERGTARQESENRFWWFNHRAVTAAVIAVAGLLLIILGISAIERSLALLFGIDASDIFYDWILPVVAFFLTPLYWLSTLPDLDEFAPEELAQPDFLSRAIGFLGQFVLVPLLFAYAVILLAFAIQIIVTRHMPTGTLGWLVLAFVITGAANWLILHPRFMRERVMVVIFRRFWFWITLLPLALLLVGLWLRVDAYGWTDERVILAAGGIWAVILSGLFLTRRFADIRWIPGLAGAVLLIASVGSWNFENAANLDQARRLDHALAVAGLTAPDDQPEWSDANAATARSAIAYLAGHEGGGEMLAARLQPLGIGFDPDQEDYGAVLEQLELPQSFAVIGLNGERSFSLSRDAALQAVDVGQTPFYRGEISCRDDSRRESVLGLELILADNQLLFFQQDAEDEQARIDLNAWVNQQTAPEYVVEPRIAFTLDGVRYLIVVESADIELGEDPSQPEPILTSLSGVLFADTAP